MRILLIVLITILMVGCTHLSYESADEKMSVTTIFKKVEGFSAVRTPDMFGIQIGSTNTDENSITAVAKILEYYANPVSAIK